MKKVIFILLLIFISIILTAKEFVLTVNQPQPSNPECNFTTIQAAILYILDIPDLNIVDPDSLDYDDHVIIEVYPHPDTDYYEENFTINYQAYVPNLTIKSCASERVVLKPDNISTAICKIINYGVTDYDPVTIEGFDFYNNNIEGEVEINEFDNDGNYGIYTSARNVFVKDCNFVPTNIIEPFVHDIYVFHPNYKPTIYLTVSNCNFLQDLSSYRFLTYARIVGYLHDPNNASNSYIFNALNNNFNNNKKSIEINNAFSITMKGNYSNTEDTVEQYDRKVSFYLQDHPDLGGDLSVIDNYINNAKNAFEISPAGLFDFSKNHILNTIESDIFGLGTAWFDNNVITFDDNISYANADFNITETSLLRNNTIYRNPQSIGDLELNLTVDNLLNNIIYGFDDSDICIPETTEIIANLFDPNMNITETNLNINGEPSFTDIASDDFSLDWPCKAIGNGYSEEFDRTDPGYEGRDMKLLTYQDETIDIGAIPFDQDRKQYHNFEGGTTTKNWTGFPALDPDNETTIFYDGITQSLPNNNMIVMFQDFTDDWGNYASVGYKDWENNEYDDFNFIWGDGSTDPTFVQPYLGYKITAQNDIDHWFGGLMQNADMDILLPATSNEIWYGYHGTETVAWYIAFADILDDIAEIKHKDWNFVWTGTEWLGESYDNSYECALKTGDFVSISLRDYNHAPASFSWNILPMNHKIPIVYRNARSVTFIEEDDYTPIFVELGDNNSIEEVAVFVGDVCKGGVQTDSKSRVMIKAFLNDIPENTELSIVTFDGAKNKRKESKLIQYSQNLAVWDNIKSLQKSNKNYYHIGIGENNDALLETTSIVSYNYPNPFNPETTIEFNNPVQGQVNINIYNLKGQLVKNVLQDNLTQGVHKVLWHGTDSNDNQVASGVYFYKIQSGNNKSVTKKIILMK